MLKARNYKHALKCITECENTFFQADMTSFVSE